MMSQRMRRMESIQSLTIWDLKDTPFLYLVSRILMIKGGATIETKCLVIRLYFSLVQHPIQSGQSRSTHYELIWIKKCQIITICLKSFFLRFLSISIWMYSSSRLLNNYCTFYIRLSPFSNTFFCYLLVL